MRMTITADRVALNDVLFPDNVKHVVIAVSKDLQSNRIIIKYLDGNIAPDGVNLDTFPATYLIPIER